MSLVFEPTSLPEVILVRPQVWGDERGFFLETYHQEKYIEGGIKEPFVQDNWSHSRKGILRGLHYQLKQPQGKLVTVLSGEIFDVAVDIRHGSPHFGKWFGANLSSHNKHQLYIPRGFAHGFLVLSDEADVYYKCTDLYDAADDRGVLWSSSEIGIPWPEVTPLLSAKDSVLRPLNMIPQSELPSYIVKSDNMT